ncbi:hypothetical protein WBN73_16640 [Paenarthrobacter sp. CCNWLY172]|uniref:Uncharacterized protein n=1 Tax=Paenarthrobacter sp. AMU7 TaxID=3162492 RepID=A0AB39YQH9_9MICC|nr:MULTISPECIES: hypothetical protein [Micrococcaceae]QSZ47423.1 hypothetical protein AYX22_02645 [Arthrobacter sp. D5-1]WGM21061.1 hypothetical protein QEH68_02380 [Paenarthrobacter sp. OM7]
MRGTPVQDKWAWVAGPIAVALGLAAHMVAGGSAPALPVLLAFAALCALAAQLISRWVHGPLLLLLLSGLAQQLLHFGFEAFGGYFPGSGLLDHLHGGPVLGDVPTGDVPTGAASGGGDRHLLLYTHMAAAILTLLVAAGVSFAVSRAKASTAQRAATLRNVE